MYVQITKGINKFVIQLCVLLSGNLSHVANDRENFEGIMVGEPVSDKIVANLLLSR